MLSSCRRWLMRRSTWLAIYYLCTGSRMSIRRGQPMHAILACGRIFVWIDVTGLGKLIIINTTLFNSWEVGYQYDMACFSVPRLTANNSVNFEFNLTSPRHDSNNFDCPVWRYFLFDYLETWTKWTKFCKRQFWIQFMEYKLSQFYYNFTDIGPYRDTIGKQSSLVQLMVCRQQATNHYLSQWWPYPPTVPANAPS